MKKIISLIGIVTLSIGPSAMVVSCVTTEQHYIPTEDPAMQSDISNFLTQFTLQQIDGEGEY